MVFEKGSIWFRVERRFGEDYGSRTTMLLSPMMIEVIFTNIH